MNRWLGAALMLGTVALVGTALRRAREEEQGETAGRGGPPPPQSLGRPETVDVLPETHSHGYDTAEQIRARPRRVAGKVVSSERAGMFTDLAGVGVSGSQGSDHGQEDRNPIGRHP